MKTGRRARPLPPASGPRAESRPSPAALEAELGPDLWALVAAAGAPVAEIVPVTTIRWAGSRRASFRLALADGQILKGRRLNTPADVTRIARLSSLLDPRHFPPVLAHRGCALLTRWIPGRPVERRAWTSARLSACGRLQAAIHRLRIPPETASVVWPAPPCTARLDRWLRELVAGGALDASDARDIDRLVVISAPASAGVGVCHTDYCADNIILTDAGGISVVDNEGITLDAQEFDLARTWYRWPMTAAQQRAYAEGYGAHDHAVRFAAHFLHWAPPGRARFRGVSRAGGRGQRTRPARAARRAATRARAERGLSSAPRSGRPLMPKHDFHFAGHAFRVEAAEPPLAWLHEFIVPHFAARDVDAPDRTITLSIDAREHARLTALGPHPEGLERACFTLDSGIVSGQVWGSPDAGDVVFDRELEVFYRRAPGEPEAVGVVAAADGAASRLALLRVVRENAMLYAARGGWLILHAAAAAIEGDAFVIAGPKRVGKTTLLVHALRNERGAYVANDRVALRAGPSGVTAHGIPTIVSIRRQSTAWFAGLDARIADAGYHYSRRMAETPAARGGTPTRPAPTWGLSPAQLCRLLGAESRVSARVTAVLFPRAGAGGDGVTFAELDAGQALDAWRGTLFRTCPPDGMFALEPDAGAPRGDGVDGLAAELAVRVPSVSCRVGPDAYRDGARWLSRSRAGLAWRAEPTRRAGG